MTPPPRFDEAYYLKHLDAGQQPGNARSHFETVGRATGLPGSPGCNQGYFLRLAQMLEPRSILEIGPGKAPKMKGPNVAYFDVKSAEELRQRYAGQTGVENVPELIHFESSTGDLGDIEDTFDVVFSCHMIEHSLDLIDHLRKVEKLLEPGGRYFVIAPDKRFTFDHYKPATTAADVIAHHVECSGVPRLSLRAYFLEKTRRTHNDIQRHWRGEHGQLDLNSEVFAAAVRQYETVNSNRIARSGYHSWFFDDVSFSRLMKDLHELGMTGLRLEACYNTLRQTCSFNAVLIKNREEDNHSGDSAHQVHHEVRGKP